jgi:non-heme chloroperoxidase
MTYVATNDADTKLYVKQWGPRDGKPVVLIHGWPLNADSWDDVALMLAEAGFRTIAYDRRGFGRSDQPWGGYDYDTLAEDLDCVIDHCARGRQVALVGFSMGGGEVARYLSKFGSRKVGLAALVASVVPLLARRDDHPDGVAQDQLDGMRADLIDDRFAFLQSFAKQFYGVGFLSKPVSQGVLDATFAMAVMAGSRPTLACMEAFATTDFRADCRAFDVPTLIIHGTSDETVPIDATARAAARAIAQAQLIEYHGAPHGLAVTHKERLARDLIDFLTNGSVAEDRQAMFDASQEKVGAESPIGVVPTLQPNM